jgi:hypothetical protein
MRNRTVKLLRSDGGHMRWIALEEGQRMVDQGQATRISRRKAPQAVFQMIAFPDASTSKPSRASLGLADAAVLATLRPREVTGLTTSDLLAMQPHRVEALQRLSGWGLLPPSKALEDYQPEQP